MVCAIVFLSATFRVSLISSLACRVRVVASRALSKVVGSGVGTLVGCGKGTRVGAIDGAVIGVSDGIGEETIEGTLAGEGEGSPDGL